jgi:adenylosuccinate synthase
LDGWTEDISHAKLISDLPKNARRYVERLEMLAGIPLTLVSVGAGRESTIVLKNPFSD